MGEKVAGYIFGFNKQKAQWELKLARIVGDGEGNATGADGKMNLLTSFVTSGTREFCQKECERLNTILLGQAKAS